MPVTNVITDAESLTMTLTAEFAAPVERLWSLFTDPRQLERFWGPPGWPATFRTFDFRVGGLAEYQMTSPTGEISAGRWEFVKIDEPHSFEVLDQFTDADGSVFEDFPAMRLSYRFEVNGENTRMINESNFASVEALEQAVEMGAVEGSTLSLNQLDRMLEGLRSYAKGKGTQLEIIDETHVAITRLVEGSRHLVWRAFTEPELLRKWMLGPDGWEMTNCQPALAAGERFRWSWAPVAGTEGEPFGFEGEALVIEEPRRMVTTERMAGTEGPSTVNDMMLEEDDGATLITTYIEYPDVDTRDMILATGMTDGMEASYARLERVLEEGAGR